jgi:CBS domain containing-hemolysin-like protein
MHISFEIEIFLVVICLILSAFFSASETALVSISELKVKHLVEEKGESAKALELWLLKPNKVLITILIGNNIVNILASVLATDLSMKIFGNIQLAIVTGFMTFLILLFAEITPKALAKHNYAKLGLVLIKPLKGFYYLFYPITYVLECFVILLNKITGIEIEKLGPSITEEEIEFLIKMGEKEGILEYQKKEMLHNIFEISERTAKEVMVPRTDMVVLDVEASFDEIFKIIKETEFSRIPVYEERLDNIIGILYVKDILKFINDKIDNIKVRSVIRKAYFVPETKKIDELLKEFQIKRIHMAIVIDEYGGVSGIVTLEDIIEEIVGEIRDEYDNEEDIKIVKVSDGLYRADARINVDDFLEYFKMENIKEKDMNGFETLGGLIYDLAGKVPEVGEEYQFNGYILKVVHKDGRKLKSIEIKKIDDQIKE